MLLKPDEKLKIFSARDSGYDKLSSGPEQKQFG